MRTLTLATIAVLLAGPASAQIVGGVTGAVDGSAGAVVATPGHVSDTTGSIHGRAGDAPAHSPSAAAPSVNVRAGVSTRVDRGTRCYYENDYYDPIYRDGTYYCETRSSGPAAAASASVRPPQR